MDVISSSRALESRCRASGAGDRHLSWPALAGCGVTDKEAPKATLARENRCRRFCTCLGPARAAIARRDVGPTALAAFAAVRMADDSDGGLVCRVRWRGWSSNRRR